VDDIPSSPWENLFFVWVTLNEQKWISFAERRGTGRPSRLPFSRAWPAVATQSLHVVHGAVRRIPGVLSLGKKKWAGQVDQACAAILEMGPKFVRKILPLEGRGRHAGYCGYYG